MVALCGPCSVRQPRVPRVTLPSAATTDPEPKRAKLLAKRILVGVLPAPPLPLSTAIVRGPGQC